MSVAIFSGLWHLVSFFTGCDPGHGTLSHSEIIVSVLVILVLYLLGYHVTSSRSGIKFSFPSNTFPAGFQPSFRITLHIVRNNLSFVAHLLRASHPILEFLCTVPNIILMSLWHISCAQCQIQFYSAK